MSTKKTETNSTVATNKNYVEAMKTADLTGKVSFSSDVTARNRYNVINTTSFTVVKNIRGNTAKALATISTLLTGKENKNNRKLALKELNTIVGSVENLIGELSDTASVAKIDTCEAKIKEYRDLMYAVNYVNKYIKALTDGEETPKLKDGVKLPNYWTVVITSLTKVDIVKFNKKAATIKTELVNNEKWSHLTEIGKTDDIIFEIVNNIK
jgi:hypothetical protein